MSVAAEEARLIEGAGALGLALSQDACRKLMRLLDELVKWSAAYNLTAIREREAMVTRHLLDSLSIHADLGGMRVADVGTGAGFPGLPLAIVSPEHRFTLIDSSGKKTRFVRHAVDALALSNVEVAEVRAERFRPEVPFDTLTARACAPLPRLLETVGGLAGPGTRMLAMKGRRLEAELGAVRSPWRIVEVRPLHVPGLDEERHLVLLTLP